MSAKSEYCNYAGCKELSSHHAGINSYCRNHYIIVNRQVNNYDQQVFNLININASLVDGLHADGLCRLSLNKCGELYALAISHEAPNNQDEQEIIRRSLTLQNLSANDLQIISRAMREISDDIDRRLK